MDKAKQAVNSFISHSGKHKTVVDEEVRPSVVDEHVRPHQHENVTTAVDKEVHQHHHHVAVQPIEDVQKLPEKHTHQTLPTQNKVVHHGQADVQRDALDRELAQFQSHSATHETTRTQDLGPTVVGERVHHHVHEHVQPVIHKEVIAPEVVHTTVPIHETHHIEAVHHGTSTLPPKTMQQWAKEGGVNRGRDAYVLGETDGCPAPYNKELQNEETEADRHLRQSHNHEHSTTSVGVGMGSKAAGQGYSENMPSGTTHARTDNLHGANRTRRASSGSSSSEETSHRVSKPSHSTAPRSEGLGTTHERQNPHVDSLGVRSGSQAKAKPSLVDKLNPFKEG